MKISYNAPALNYFLFSLSILIIEYRLYKEILKFYLKIKSYIENIN